MFITMTHTSPPKALTHDEKKAADAAFAGRPFNEAWSASARTIYDGIVKALPHTNIVIPLPSTVEEPAEAPSAQSEPLQPQEPLAQEHVAGQELAVEGTVMPSIIHDRETAANAMGINTAASKLRVFVLSALLAAVAGVFFTHYTGAFL